MTDLPASSDKAMNGDSRPNQIRQHDSPDESVRDNTASVQITRIILNERAVTILIAALLAVLAGVALARSESAATRANDAEREARMLQYYVLEMDAKLITAGVKRPDEAVANKLKQEK